MNQITIIGNLTRDPESRTTASGQNVCSFTVAVNGKKGTDATFFRVSAWRELGENCQKFLAKGRKVCVVGPVSVSTYTCNDGSTRASLEVIANSVEFLSQLNEAPQDRQQPKTNTTDNRMPKEGWTEVNDEDLPF